jgi:hypothetical protein
MRNRILSAVLFVILVVLDVYATQNLGKPTVASYNAEFMSDWFTGSFCDWLGLVGINIIWAIIGIAASFNITLAWEEKGSVGVSVGVGFVASVLLLSLIYFA